MPQPERDGEAARPKTLVSRIRAAVNIITLLAAIAFVVFLVLSRGDATFEWYAARAGLIAIFGLLASFVAILIENRQGPTQEESAR